MTWGERGGGCIVEGGTSGGGGGFEHEIRSGMRGMMGGVLILMIGGVKL